MTIEQIKFEFNHLSLRSILLDIAMVKKFGREAVAEYKYYQDQLYRLEQQR